MRLRNIFKVAVFTILTLNLSTVASQNLFAGLSPINGIVSSNKIDSSFLNSICESISKYDYVFLGEANHGDGSNHKVKSEIVKTLHRKFGYDVLLMEEDFFHLESMRSIMGVSKFADSTNIFNNVWDIWSETEDCKELLYDIIPFDTISPFHLSGFDIRLQGVYAKGFLSIKTDSFLQSSGIKFTKSKEYDEFFVNYLRYSIFYKIQDSTNVIRFRDDCKAIKQELIDKRVIDKFWLLVFDNFIAFTDVLLEQPRNIITCTRDKQMANVVKYLIEGPYKEKKIIFWGQSGHFFKNHSQLLNGFYSMGEILFEDSFIRNKSFVLACTSYEGEYLNHHNGRIDKIPKSRNSIERRILEKGNFVFINSKQLPENERNFYFNGKAHFAAHSFFTTNWSNSIDGIIFMKNSYPVKYIHFYK